VRFQGHGWRWVARNHSGVREWLVLLAAVVAVVVGYQQIADERDARKASEQRFARAETRAQAEKISAWIAGDTEEGMPAVLANRSDQPVYEVIAYRVAAYGAAPHTGKELGEEFGEFRTFSILPPGIQKTDFAYGWNAMGLRPGVEIAFRDQAGINWVRLADGLLKQIDRRPVDYYDLAENQEWSTP
jgi:hypothetical protein